MEGAVVEKYGKPFDMEVGDIARLILKRAGLKVRVGDVTKVVRATFGLGCFDYSKWSEIQAAKRFKLRHDATVGRDFADGSDCKVVSIRAGFSSGKRRYYARVDNCGTKKGDLIIKLINPTADEYHPVCIWLRVPYKFWSKKMRDRHRGCVDIGIHHLGHGVTEPWRKYIVEQDYA